VITVEQEKTEIGPRVLNREVALGNFQRPAPPLGRTSASCGRPILVAVYVGDLRRKQLAAALPMRQLRRLSEEAQRQRTMYGRGVLNDPPMILTCSWPTCGCRGWCGPKRQRKRDRSAHMWLITSRETTFGSGKRKGSTCHFSSIGVNLSRRLGLSALCTARTYIGDHHDVAATT
jgi:hypothetical protein